MIKAVDEIPMTAQKKRESRRKAIYQDIMDGINSGVEKFEIEGDYNYKYLAQYVREETNGILNKILHDRWGKEDRQPYEQGKVYRNYPAYYDRHIRNYKYILVHNAKMEDRNHVYCEICPDALDEMIEAHKRHLEVLAQREIEREAKKGDGHD